MIGPNLVTGIAASALLLTGCGVPQARSVALVDNVVPAPATVISVATDTPAATWTLPAPTDPPPTQPPTETAVPPTATPHPTLAPDSYVGLSIDELAEREFPEAGLSVESVLAVTAAFTRTLVSYPGDGLKLYGFMNQPVGPGPFPVVLVLHGYVNPANYRTVAYTYTYADALARAGFLVVHPNYRGHPPSDPGPDRFRVGYAIDVLALIAAVEAGAGQPGPLLTAAPRIGLFGHSMGGGITLRVITASRTPLAALMYGSMSGDERQNYERIRYWSGGTRGATELATLPEDLERIAPIHHLDRITAAVSIHHGRLDDQVPPEWSDELCARLQALEKRVDCFDYPDQPHTFTGAGATLLMERAIDFFRLHLTPGEPPPASEPDDPGA